MKIVIKGARMAFANIWEPKAIVGANGKPGEPRCGCSLILDPKTQGVIIKAVRAKIVEVATEKWAAKAQDILKSLNAKGDLCLRNGDTKAEFDGFDGMWYVAANNTARPIVVDKDKSQLTQADGRVYAGCYVNASLDIWAQDNQWGKRVNAKLLAIQFDRDGEAFSGGEGYSDDDFDASDKSDGGSAGGDDMFGGDSADDGLF